MDPGTLPLGGRGGQALGGRLRRRPRVATSPLRAHFARLRNSKSGDPGHPPASPSPDSRVRWFQRRMLCSLPGRTATAVCRLAVFSGRSCYLRFTAVHGFERYAAFLATVMAKPGSPGTRAGARCDHDVRRAALRAGADGIEDRAERNFARNFRQSGRRRKRVEPGLLLRFFASAVCVRPIVPRRQLAKGELRAAVPAACPAGRPPARGPAVRARRRRWPEDFDVPAAAPRTGRSLAEVEDGKAHHEALSASVSKKQLVVGSRSSSSRRS